MKFLRIIYVNGPTIHHFIELLKQTKLISSKTLSLKTIQIAQGRWNFLTELPTFHWFIVSLARNLCIIQMRAAGCVLSFNCIIPLCFKLEKLIKSGKEFNQFMNDEKTYSYKSRTFYHLNWMVFAYIEFFGSHGWTRPPTWKIYILSMVKLMIIQGKQQTFRLKNEVIEVQNLQIVTIG